MAEMDIIALKNEIKEQVFKIQDVALLNALKTILEAKSPERKRTSFKEFAVLNDEEVSQLEKIIEAGCEKINPDDWK